MTFDESFAYITNELAGRTVEHVERQGKQLIICTTCGHEVKLQADVNGDIQYRGTGVRIILSELTLCGDVGRF